MAGVCLSETLHTPDGASEDTPLLNLISSHLSSGRSSRLQQLLAGPGLLMDIGVWNDGGIAPGLFYYSQAWRGRERRQGILPATGCQVTT